eukprot:CAMPEP_0184478712 /NCGR_PEP_ID=MMETSP0113_2-20130426/667_1 /TAXON_ID=91329 /ORGANISM="Norrisiella sphaerica, Strain BC52" /LENGTH=174 /DNA_ID=CAMNT_0026856599 /DNA_START=42 /DNA_END=566 /DNA_ORIENTATION=+
MKAPEDGTDVGEGDAEEYGAEISQIIIPSVFEAGGEEEGKKKKKKKKKKKRKGSAPGDATLKEKKRKKSKKANAISLPSADSVVIPDWDVAVESSGDEGEPEKKKYDPKDFDNPNRPRVAPSGRYNNVAPPAALLKVDEEEAFRLRPYISRSRQEEIDAKKKKAKENDGLDMTF